MHINNQVVHALMHLRGIDNVTLAGLAHITAGALWSWVQHGSDEAVSFEQQLEILNFLGVRSETPRSDVVHHWKVHENLFSRSSSTYWALQVVLKAFGDAEAVFIARETDPALSFSAQAHFGLKFNGFIAILSVTAHPLRSVSFDPGGMAGLSWTPDTLGVLLPEDEYARIGPGSMKVKSLNQYINYSAEMPQWQRLREQAQAQGIRAEQVASLLLGGAAPSSMRIEATSPPPDKGTAVSTSVNVHLTVPAAAPPEEAATAASAPAARTEDLFRTPVRAAHLKRA
jgi:hypothetical protein